MMPLAETVKNEKKKNTNYSKTCAYNSITVDAVDDGGNDNLKLNGRKFSFINASLDQS